MKNMTCIVEDNLNLDNLHQGNNNHDDNFVDRIKGNKPMNNTLSITEGNLTQDNLSRDDNNLGNLGTNVGNNSYYYGANSTEDKVLSITEDNLRQDNLNQDDNRDDDDNNNLDNNKLSFDLALSFIQANYRHYYGADNDNAEDKVDITNLLRNHWPDEDPIHISDIAASIAATVAWVPKDSCTEWAAAHGAYII